MNYEREMLFVLMLMMLVMVKDVSHTLHAETLINITNYITAATISVSSSNYNWYQSAVSYQLSHQ